MVFWVFFRAAFLLFPALRFFAMLHMEEELAQEGIRADMLLQARPHNLDIKGRADMLLQAAKLSCLGVYGMG